MGRVISVREIMLFIAKFGLWNAYLESSDAGVIPGGIGLRVYAEDGQEYSYVLFCDGSYEIEVWRDPNEEGIWTLIKSGNIFEEEIDVENSTKQNPM